MSQITLKDQCTCMSEVLKEYDSVHASRVMTRALRLREHSRGFKPQNRARLKPATKVMHCPDLGRISLRYSRSFGRFRRHRVIGREEIKKQLLKNSAEPSKQS